MSCCKDPTPGALQADPRAALRAGGRIRIEKNTTEDPRAPLLTKSLNTLHEKEAELLDKDLEALVEQMSSGGDDLADDDLDLIAGEEEDENNQKKE